MRSAVMTEALADPTFWLQRSYARMLGQKVATPRSRCASRTPTPTRIGAPRVCHSAGLSTTLAPIAATQMIPRGAV